jgi:FkbM family methyltransferase
MRNRSANNERRCKCCGALATFFGSADFGKSSSNAQALAGWSVEYFRCQSCGFLFSTFLDDWPPERLRREIYNDDYLRFDPEFAATRPERTARLLEMLFGKDRAAIRILDYGGGDGGLARRLRDSGFVHAHSFDPFHDTTEAPPGSFDLITCIEVFEHLAQPDAVLKACRHLLAKPGLLLFSTITQPPDIEQCGVGWGYLAPRNGHVSLHSRRSLEIICERHGFSFGSINDHVHMAWRGLPAFAAHLASYPRPGPMRELAALPAEQPVGSGVHEVAGQYGILRYPVDDRIGRSFEAGGGYAEGAVELFRRTIRQGSVVIDAGAHVGAIALPLSHMVGALGKVIAYEPRPYLFRMLLGNVARSGAANVVACHAALGERGGWTWLPPGNDGGEARVRPAMTTDPVTRIRVETIDGLGLSHLNLIKIDVGEMERDVISGAKHTISRLRPLLYVANGRRERSARVIALIQELGYRLWWHNIHLFCVPAERPAEISILRPVTSPEDWPADGDGDVQCHPGSGS